MLPAAGQLLHRRLTPFFYTEWSRIMTHASEKRILVVDDEPDIRNYLANCLEDVGFQVDTAVDGQDALDKVAVDPPDLMTLDLIMPRKSGISVIKELRADEELAKLPIIVITAHARDEWGSDDIKAASAFALGMKSRYTLEKPVTPEGLISTISDILEVEVEEKPDINQMSDREAISNMLNGSDPETLKKIREMLADA